MDAEGQDGAKKKKKYTKKERKQMKREKIAVLKQLVDRPDVVDVHDVNASDPGLLVHLKSLRNTVPVPRHWSQRRKYLQGKRGIEKPPFELPGTCASESRRCAHDAMPMLRAYYDDVIRSLVDFIKATGIATIRQAIIDKEEQMKAKQKQRERVSGKMGKIDIDYQVLYDAFFRFQTKPKLSIHGDLYYEGKEFEVNMKERKPGVLSRELKEALGMGDLMPPPWLKNMQRFGPPPSYPNLIIPGLNAPPPPGCAFGDLWGFPPVDEVSYRFDEAASERANGWARTIVYSHWRECTFVDSQQGRPLYRDWSLVPESDHTTGGETSHADMKPWGELEQEEEEEEEEMSGTCSTLLVSLGVQIYNVELVTHSTSTWIDIRGRAGGGSRRGWRGG